MFIRSFYDPHPFLQPLFQYSIYPFKIFRKERTALETEAAGSVQLFLFHFVILLSCQGLLLLPAASEARPEILH
jgi:hypothetical protein